MVWHLPLSYRFGRWRGSLDAIDAVFLPAGALSQSTLWRSAMALASPWLGELAIWRVLGTNDFVIPFTTGEDRWASLERSAGQA